MARNLFGGTAADVAEYVDGTRVPGAIGTVWDSPDGGTQLTDLTDTVGAAIRELVADSNGLVPAFYGPEGYERVYADFGSGRVCLISTNIGERLRDHVAAQDPHGDRKFVTDLKGAANGLASLDANGKIPAAQLPTSTGSANLTVADADVRYVKLSSTGVANGVATLGPDGKLTGSQVPATSGGSGLPAPANFLMTADTSIPLPSGTPADGQVHRVFAVASGAQRVATFHTDYRLSSVVTSRAVTVPVGQALIAEAVFSSLAQSWVLIQAVVTSGAASGGSVGKPIVSAGADATLTTSQSFSRTASENANGGTISARSWSIVDGPMGTGTTIGTTTALTWTPGSSPAGTTDIRQPVFQEMAFEITSTAENGTVVWTTAYGYIEDIGDQRGYTAGLVGFCSGTGDMLTLVRNYTNLNPNNVLAPYLPGLEYCAEVGFGPGASQAAATRLGQPYITAWKDAAKNDPLFRQAQRDLRKKNYWDDALAQALADGVGPLGLALYYDILVNHGPGNDYQSFGGILAAGRSSTTKPPSAGGAQPAWLLKLCDLRDAVLDEWGDLQTDGRSVAFRHLINTGNLTLTGNVSWPMYGTTHTINRPNPPADALIGKWTLRYSASNAAGTSTDDLVITVQEDLESGNFTPLIESLADNFDDNAMNTSLWSGNYGSVTETGGHAQIAVNTSYCALASGARYKVAGSKVHAKVTAPAAAGATSNCYVMMQLVSASAPEGTMIATTINTYTGKIRFSNMTDYWDSTAAGSELTYDATAHAWLRVREASGTLYWETSPDGTTWTVRRSLATPQWLAAATDVSLTFETHRDAGTTNYALVDSVNTA
ncbi:chitosanase [Streptomyces werraensis]|uniref:chitosanase n=1 Tax=Streptomyces werraensis TaxID=68284 RepID=UPI0036FE28DD